MKNILITTKHRGVWFAQVEQGTDLTPTTLTGLKNCRCAIYWATKNGLQELCKVGPNSNSRISDASGIEVIHDVTAVFSVTDEAAAQWLNG